MGKICFGAILTLVMVFLMVVPARGQESAIFFSQLPPGPVEAGKTVVLRVSITNAGTESWLSGTFQAFIKVYSFDKEYLTATDKVRELVEVEPGETISRGVSFEIPLDYAGTYFYTVNVEIEDKRVLESHYFKLVVRPFLPEPVERPHLTGNFRLAYQANQGSQSTSDFNLSLADRISPREYRTFSLSGDDLGLESAQVSTFLITHTLLTGRGQDKQDKIELRVGDICSALSPLTVNKIRGLKLGFTRGRTYLAGLAGVNRHTFSSEISPEPNIYGFKLSTDPTEDLSLGMNFCGAIETEATQPLSEATGSSKSVVSLEMVYDLTPSLGIVAEYAWAIPSPEGSESATTDSEAFQVEASFEGEKMYAEGSYRKVGKDFTVPGSEGLSRDYLEYDLFVDYLVSRYLTAGFYYYTSLDDLSRKDEGLTWTTKSIDLSFRRPSLPLLILSYDIDETKGASGDSLGFPVDDITYTLHGAISHHIGSTRLSVGYFSSYYQDLTVAGLEDDFSLVTYGISTKWGDRLALSARQYLEQKEMDEVEEECSRILSVAMTYSIIPLRLTLTPSWKIKRSEEHEEGQTTTMATLRYLVSSSNILECSYSLTNDGGFTNLDAVTADELKVNLRWGLDLGENDRLDLSYVHTGKKDFIENTGSDNSSIGLTYRHSF